MLSWTPLPVAMVGATTEQPCFVFRRRFARFAVGVTFHVTGARCVSLYCPAPCCLTKASISAQICSNTAPASVRVASLPCGRYRAQRPTARQLCSKVQMTLFVATAIPFPWKAANHQNLPAGSTFNATVWFICWLILKLGRAPLVDGQVIVIP
jgi:hypothetical protein